MSKLGIDADSWAELERLLDEALDRPAAERDSWVDSLPAGSEALKPQLRALLSHAAAVETADFLQGPPRLADEAAAQQPGATIGPYRLVREIARGGMGSVWLAERVDGLFDRSVALKLPHAESHYAGFAERMARERAILGGLEHPHIARLYDAGITPEGQPFLALEYVDGRPIDRHCGPPAAPDALDLATRLRLFVDVAEAVAYAHAKLVIHRDLKPANVLVTAAGDVRLLDFGIASLLADGQSRTSALTELTGRALTPDYASPEQIRGEPLTVATDVYSLGVLLYELLTGRRPYRLERDSRALLEEAILHVDPARPSDATARAWRARVRGDLDTIVLQALQKAPTARYSTASAFADDVRRYLEHRPVLAQPDSGWYRTARFARRNRVAVAALSAVGVALATGAGVAAWQARTAIAERDRAEEVKNFIASVFQDADPYAGKGEQLSAVDLLRQAQARVDLAFADRPALQVELLDVIATSLLNLQDHELADAVAERALALAHRSLGPGHPLTQQVEITRLGTDRFRGRTEQMRARLLPMLERARNDPAVPPARRVALLNLAMHLAIDEQRNADAESLAREALGLAEAQLGPAHAATVDSTLGLAVALLENRKLDAAPPVARLAVERMQALHRGLDAHPRVLDARFTLGRTFAAAGRTGDAIVELADIAQRAAAVYGADSPFEAYVLHYLARAQGDVGLVDAALATHERSRGILASVLEPDSVPAGVGLAVRAELLLAAARVDEAERAFAGAVRILAARLGPEHASADTNRALHAIALARTGHAREAEATIAAIGARGPALTGTAAISFDHASGIVARLAGRPQDAVDAQRSALEHLGSGPREPWARARVLTELGLALHAVGDAAAAVDGLTAALDAWRELHGDAVTPTTAELRMALATLARADGQGARADELLREAARSPRTFTAGATGADASAAPPPPRRQPG